MTPKEQRAIAIRDAALTVLKRQGALDGPGKTAGPWLYWDWRAGGRIDISLHNWITRHPSSLPTGIDIWLDRHKVINIEWDDDGKFSILSFKRGDWEDTLLQMAQDRASG